MKIVVVDDDPNVLLASSEFIKEAGYEVLTASSGKETLKVVGKDRPDLVLLDVALPDTEGTEVCRRIKDDPSLRGPLVVLLSDVRTSSESQAEGLEAGADGYILRPIPDRELLARVQSLVRLKQAEEVLQASETRYRRLFETAQDGILILDADTGRITDVNPFLAEMLGHGHEDFLGKELWEIGAFKDIELSKGAFSELQTKGYVRYEDLPLRTKDGRLVDVEFVSNVYLVNHQRVIQCDIREITERKRAEEELQRAHDELDLRVKERTVELAIANEQLSREIEQQEQAEEFLEERLQFECLISDLSASFVNLPSDEVDSEINKWLRRIAEFFGVERCSLGPFSKGGAELVRAFEYHSEEAEPAPESISREQLPWYFEQLIRGNPVVINRVEDLPAEAEKERHLCLAKGMKSVLSIPMVSGGTTLGSCALVSVRTERVWPQVLVRRFRLVTEVFANALERRRTESILRTSEEKFRQFFRNTPDYCYIISPGGNILNLSNAALQALGCEREELIGQPLAMIYAPEFLPKMKELLDRWKKGGEIKNEEMVIITKNGEKRVVLLNVGTIRGEGGAILHSASVQTDITERKQMEEELQARLREIEGLKQRLEKENIYLREEIKLQYVHEEIVGRSEAMKKVLAQVEQVARTDSTVLIQGETGTGKELLAQAIHRLSSRKDRPLVTVNCASLPPTLIEGELFGREKGAYTGALTRMVGRLEGQVP